MMEVVLHLDIQFAVHAPITAVTSQFGHVVSASRGIVAVLVVVFGGAGVGSRVFEDGWEEVAEEGAEGGQRGGDDDEIGFNVAIEGEVSMEI